MTDLTNGAIAIALLFLGMIIGIFIFYVFRLIIEGKTKKSLKKEAHRITNQAQSKASRIERDSRSKAKDFEARARRNVESDIRKQKQKLQNMEYSLKDKQSRLERDYKNKSEKLDHKGEALERRDFDISVLEKRMKESEVELQKKVAEMKDKIAAVSQLSEQQAREEIKKALEDDVRKEISEELTRIEEQAREESKQKGKRILATAISRLASEVATERTVNIMALTSDEMKGKIIGREGRNIRALEATCGVDLIIDETPESIVISSFDPVRREVAQRSIEKLIEDGRVHPARIEEVVGKCKADLFVQVREDGEQVCMDAGVHGVHPSVQNTLGLLKYRHSGMQNTLKQSIEVSHVAGLLAAELGANIKLAKRVGLLHAVGMGLDHTVEGSYAKVGADFLKKHKETSEVCQAILAQNNAVEPTTLLDHILQAAVHLASSRTGSRRQSMESYIKRLSDLESIGNSFDGVHRTIALQSGKEIRVMVEGEKITEGQAKMLTRDIARKIERELNYPGQIKVAVLRETRTVEHAR